MSRLGRWIARFPWPLKLLALAIVIVMDTAIGAWAGFFRGAIESWTASHDTAMRMLWPAARRAGEGKP